MPSDQVSVGLIPASLKDTCPCVWDLASLRISSVWIVPCFAMDKYFPRICLMNQPRDKTCLRLEPANWLATLSPEGPLVLTEETFPVPIIWHGFGAPGA